MSSSLEATLFSFVGKTQYGAMAQVSYDNQKSDGASTGIYQYLQNGTSQTDHQTFQTPIHNLNAELGLGISRPLGKQLMNRQTINEEIFSTP